MGTIKLNELKKQYEFVCNAYAKAFAKKHDYQFDSWVEVGTIACFGDYFVDFHDIKHDIDNDIPKEKFLEYYDAILDYSSLNNEKEMIMNELIDNKLRPFPNYKHWLKGAPRPTQEEMDRLRKAVHEAKTILEKEIEHGEN